VLLPCTQLPACSLLHAVARDPTHCSMSAPSVQCFWSCLVMPRRWAGLCFHPFLTAPLPPPPSKRPTDPYTRVPPPQPTSTEVMIDQTACKRTAPPADRIPDRPHNILHQKATPWSLEFLRGVGPQKFLNKFCPPTPQTVANHIVSSCWRAVCVCTNMVLTWFYNKTQSVAYHRWSQSAARPGKASFYARNGQNMLDALVPTRERCLRPKVTPLLEQLPV